MWIARFKLTSFYGAARSSSMSSLQSAINAHYSTEKHQPHFIVDYLVNSLGFSKDQALSVSTKVSHLKSTQKPDSVVDFFKRCGLHNTQIRSIICFSPKILNTSVDKTLEPKFRVFQKLGLSGSGLEKLFKPSPNFSTNRLDSNVNYLRKLLGSDEKVIRVIERSWWLLSSNYALKLSANLLVLKKYGLSDDRVLKILMKNPGSLLQNHQWLEEKVKQVEPLLGISCDSPRFVDGFEILASLSKSTLEMKFEAFKSFGWSDSEILTMTRALPTCLRGSVCRLEMYLNFFMNELGYTALYLATHPKLLVYSLRRRILPRNKVLEILKAKKTFKTNFSFCSLVALSEAKFVSDFVLPYLDLVPDLNEVYANAKTIR